MTAVQFVQKVIDSKDAFIPQKTHIFDFYRTKVCFDGVLLSGDKFSYVITDKEEIKQFFHLFNSNFRKGL